MFEVQILPLYDHNETKQQDGICPKILYKNQWRKSHAIPPIVDPAGIAAFVFHEPLKRTEHRNTELIHEYKEYDNYVDPHVRKNSCYALHPHNRKKQKPVKT